jgi:hypothetical protein
MSRKPKITMKELRQLALDLKDESYSLFLDLELLINGGEKYCSKDDIEDRFYKVAEIFDTMDEGMGYRYEY